ncbi:CAP domain-containing protein [Naematelia encephala]|uniref:CAP domain-containing protein n=1 Tax=Naematelia encephala TaxID=71784 RepID=A0A1Y2B2X2_9TREE|nr:CAP domain-containing protein [Naematelia encephala]
MSGWHKSVRGNLPRMAKSVVAFFFVLSPLVQGGPIALRSGAHDRASSLSKRLAGPAPYWGIEELIGGDGCASEDLSQSSTGTSSTSPTATIAAIVRPSSATTPLSGIMAYAHPGGSDILNPTKIVGPPPVSSSHSLDEPSQTSTSTDQSADAWVKAHNAARNEYQAGNVTWNSDLVTIAQSNAQLCTGKHSNAGENIAAQSGSLTPQGSVDMWMSEAADYNWNDPAYSDATGHFTQVIWLATTEIGCFIAECPAGTVFGSQYGISYQGTCEYKSAGNVVSEWQIFEGVLYFCSRCRCRRIRSQCAT